MVGETKPEHPLPSRRPPLSRRQLLMQLGVAGVILVSGIIIGTGGTILALQNRMVPRVRWMPVEPPGPEPNAIVARWTGTYELSDKQARQVTDILTKQFTELRDIRQKLFQAEQTARDKSAASMRKTLSPEQYTKWDQDMKKWAEQFERWRASRGPRGDRKGPPRGERGPDRPRDPNEHRWDGPPRPPMDGEGPRGGWPPRPPSDPNGRRGSWLPRGSMDRPPPPETPAPGPGPDGLPNEDRPLSPPAELRNRPEETNTPG